MKKEVKVYLLASLALVLIVGGVLIFYFFFMKKAMAPTGSDTTASGQVKTDTPKSTLSDKKTAYETSGVAETKESIVNDLGALADNIDKTKTKENEAVLKERKAVKESIGNYLNTINADGDVLGFIAPNSLAKIEAETKDTYGLFNAKEKDLFLSDIKKLGYNNATFDVNNTDDMHMYINSVVKSGLKSVGEIEDFSIDRFEKVEDKENEKELTYVEYSVKFKDNKKKKTLKVFLEDGKFRVSL